MGENENECVIIHSKKAGVILRGEALNVWVYEGQQKWYSERVTTVLLGWDATDGGVPAEYRNG